MIDVITESYGWLAWLPFTIYYFSGMPQILLNYRNKSTVGLSYRMIFFDYTGNFSTTIYTFLLVLPIACRIMEPLCLFNVSILVMQCFYYCKDSQARRFLTASYLLLHAVAAVFVCLAWWYPTAVGMAMGWVSVIVQLFTQLPQVLKNRQRRSVKGLSFWYISLLGFAGLMEMVIAYMLSLPVQNFLNGLRAVGYYTVLCLQFYWYRH